MNAPPISARSTASKTFSTATSTVGSGASKRSSISRMTFRSRARSIAGPCNAVRNTVRATTPGKRTVEKLALGANGRKHLAEHEQEKEGLDQRLQQKNEYFPPDDQQIA